MKQVGTVTASQFGYLYLGGVPYQPKKVQRFLNKGLGIKVQDIVIFDFDMVDGERVLNYCKNAIYADGKELLMVKEFVKASELQRASSTITDGVSDQMKKELAEEGICITNEGVFLCPPEGTEQPEDKIYPRDIPAEVLAVMTTDERRTLSIMLQSQIKNALDALCPECADEIDEAKEVAIDLVRWIDRNSTQILIKAERYLEAQKK
jgi:hypothetical protein